MPARSRSGSTPDAPRPANRIARLDLDDPLVVRRVAEIEHERSVAIRDLLSENRFALVDGEPGPYHVRIGLEEDRLILDIRNTEDSPLQRIGIALQPFRRIIKDYFTVCESYFDAVRQGSPARIEAIDMGRRGLHNEGSELLSQRLAGKIDLDRETARRLFTLMCVLHIR